MTYVPLLLSIYNRVTYSRGRVYVVAMQKDDAKDTDDAFHAIRDIPSRVYVEEEI